MDKFISEKTAVKALAIDDGDFEKRSIELLTMEMFNERFSSNLKACFSAKSFLVNSKVFQSQVDPSALKLDTAKSHIETFVDAIQQPFNSDFKNKILAIQKEFLSKRSNYSGFELISAPTIKVEEMVSLSN